MKPYRANFHTHTTASFDGYNSYKAIYSKCCLLYTSDAADE